MNYNSDQSLENELCGLQKTVKLNKDTANTLAAEKDNRESQVKTFTKAFKKAQDTLKSQEHQIAQLRKELAHIETQLK